MFKGYLQAYHSKESMTSLYSFFPANSLLLGILEGFNTTTLSPPAVLVSKIKYIKREHSKKLFFKPKERSPSGASCHYRSGQKGTKLSKSCFKSRIICYCSFVSVWNYLFQSSSMRRMTCFIPEDFKILVKDKRAGNGRNETRY